MAETDEAELQPGDRVDHYVIEKKLGSGGFAEVYQARDASGQKVAIKMLNRDAALDKNTLRRFLREAQASSIIDHPNIVQVLAYGDHARQPYLVMELLQGETVAERVRRRGALSPRDAVPILSDVANALARAHDAGVIHRDLKPENLFLVENDGVRVLDFGIAKFPKGPGELKTATRAILGTLHTMSPEQCRSSKSDARSDVYALGVVAYYMLAGDYPFSHAHDLEIAVAHLKEAPPPLRDRQPSVPVELAEIVHRCLEKEPARRFQSMRELRDAMAGHLGERGRGGGRRAGIAIGAALGLAIVGGAGWVAWSGWAQPALQARAGEVAVTLDVQPADAQVTVDGAPRSDGPPFVLRGRPGTRLVVTCARDGYRPLTRELVIGRADRRETLALKPR